MTEIWINLHQSDTQTQLKFTSWTIVLLFNFVLSNTTTPYSTGEVTPWDGFASFATVYQLTVITVKHCDGLVFKCYSFCNSNKDSWCWILSSGYIYKTFWFNACFWKSVTIELNIIEMNSMLRLKCFIMCMNEIEYHHVWNVLLCAWFKLHVLG